MKPDLQEIINKVTELSKERDVSEARFNAHIDIFNIKAFLEAHNAWANSTFGDSNVRSFKSPLNHLKEELIEIEENPTDISEWADAFSLFMNAMYLQGITLTQLGKACFEKLSINKRRTWHKVGEGDNAYYKHD